MARRKQSHSPHRRFTLAHLIPPTAIQRYEAAPPPSTVIAVKRLHETIRAVLGSGYETFLQGSYKNDTGVADLNDVDIVALRKSVMSTYFNNTTATQPISWEKIFLDLQVSLEMSPYYRGKTERGDKCITVNTDFHADVVPAINISASGSDPIAVFSFREGKERKNFPRVHYERSVEKQARTFNAYKPTVRMYKRWARRWFNETNIAPSFYVECLVHSVPCDNFSMDAPSSFLLVGDYIVRNISQYSVVTSVAGDKDILTNAEWLPFRYEQFRKTLDGALGLVAQAFEATSPEAARRYWRSAFNE